MKSVVVLVVLAACAHTCLAVPAPATEAAPALVTAPAANPSAAPAAVKPEEPAAPAAPAVPVVPVEPAAAKPASTASSRPPQDSTPAAPAVPVAPAAAPAVADVANKMGQLVAAPALNSTKGAISVQVLPPLLPKCSANSDCVSLLGQHSACRDYWCECVDGAKYESGFSKRCLRVVSAIGDSCKEAGDCRRIANTYCKAGRCHCNKDFVFSDSGAACLKVATAENPSCSEDRQCVRLLNSATGPDGPAVCVDGKCMCRYDHVFENGTCVHKQVSVATIGVGLALGMLLRDMDLMGPALEENGTDDAAPPDEPMQGDQPAAAARGKSCAADAECADLDGGACVQGVCGCKTNFVPAVAANKCLPVQRSLAAACEEDIQCSEGLGDLGRCSAGKCACPDGAVLGADNKCACADDEELNKAANRCEKAAPGKQLQQQQPAKEGQLRDNKGGAGSLQSSATVVIALLACAAYSLA